MSMKPLTKDLRTTIWGLAAFIESEVNLKDFSLLIRDKNNSDIKQVAVILIEAKQKLNRVILQ
ncbi:MAG: hypothetical protein CL666_13725 [Balneola sp.]|nr:hypothetical protein [Balneola sp.]|tara:strand:+ start:2016 stop:2204 length:189 start_codon:yes stop_codon:yes gene_type:complete